MSSRDIKEILTEFYNSYDEDSRLKSRHGMVEFLTTMHYIETYLKSGDRVLEVGAGTGRYSHALARQGYRVDAVELVEHNIKVFRENTQENENIRVIQGNALDLSAFEDHTYDMTLLLGPLYHLYSLEDKRRAVSEALRVTKKDGIIFAAHVISDGCLLDEGFNRGNISVKAINEQISNFAQSYPANSITASIEAPLLINRYRFVSCSCFSCFCKKA